MRSETIHSLLFKQAVDVMKCLLNAPAALPSVKEPQVHLNRRLDGPRAGLNVAVRKTEFCFFCRQSNHDYQKGSPYRNHPPDCVTLALNKSEMRV
jgi:hypothetical protein